MPRSRTSEASRIVDFFRSRPLDAAELAYGLVSDIMRARRPPGGKPRLASKTPRKPNRFAEKHVHAEVPDA